MNSNLAKVLLPMGLLSLGVTVGLYWNELARRPDPDLLIYVIFWIIVVLIFLLAIYKFINTSSLTKLLLLIVATGYFSSVLAYVLLGLITMPNVFSADGLLLDLLMISLFYPVMVFRGFSFTIIFMISMGVAYYFVEDR